MKPHDRGVVGRHVRVKGWRGSWVVAEAGKDWLHLRDFPIRPGDPGHTFERKAVHFVRGRFADAKL